jgi:hypothetical protein
MTGRTTMAATGRRRVQRTVLGVGLAGALVFSGASIAQAATAPTPTPSASAPTAAPTTTATPAPTGSPTVTPSASATTPAPTPTATTPVIASVLTIKGKTAGTGTNFSGNYKIQSGAALAPAQSRIVDLQRKTPTGWDTVQSDAADVNGNVVYGTVRSHFVQTWRLVTKAATTDPDYAISSSIKVAQNGRAVSALTFPTAGIRTGKQVAFTGYFTYRSWWITSGPDADKQGFVAPVNARVYLQYLSGKTWRTKTSVLTEDVSSAGVNASFKISTQTSKARSWRLYYPGSPTRTAAVSKTLVK